MWNSDKCNGLLNVVGISVILYFNIAAFQIIELANSIPITRKFKFSNTLFLIPLKPQ